MSASPGKNSLPVEVHAVMATSFLSVLGSMPLCSATGSSRLAASSLTFTCNLSGIMLTGFLPFVQAACSG